jgi:hypothetical protein
MGDGGGGGTAAWEGGDEKGSDVASWGCERAAFRFYFWSWGCELLRGRVGRYEQFSPCFFGRHRIERSVYRPADDVPTTIGHHL